MKECVEGVRFRWLWTPGYQGNGPGRILNMLTFLAWLFFLVPWSILRHHHVVVASSTYPLDMVPAWLMARCGRSRLLFEVHDLWPLSPIELGNMSPRHAFIRLMQWGENFAYRHCDTCVSLLPAALEHMRAHGLHEEKFRYVPNGVDLAEWGHNREPLTEEHRHALKSLRDRRGVLVGYLGTHGLANALHTFLHAAAILRDAPVGFVLIGGGPEKAALVHEAARARLDDVVLFLPAVGKRQVPAALAELDLLYIGLQRQPLFRFGISPNKIFDYMMAGRPIINGIEAGNDPIAEAGCGRSVPPEDATALADAVRELLALSAEERESLGRRGRSYVESRHQVKDLAARMLQAQRGAA
jgi:glycosyltransferase involved in cell wall biosynthesis